MSEYEEEEDGRAQVGKYAERRAIFEGEVDEELIYKLNDEDDFVCVLEINDVLDDLTSFYGRDWVEECLRRLTKSEARFARQMQKERAAKEKAEAEAEEAKARSARDYLLSIFGRVGCNMTQ